VLHPTRGRAEAGIGTLPLDSLTTNGALSVISIDARLRFPRSVRSRISRPLSSEPLLFAQDICSQFGDDVGLGAVAGSRLFEQLKRFVVVVPCKSERDRIANRDKTTTWTPNLTKVAISHLSTIGRAYPPFMASASVVTVKRCIPSCPMSYIAVTK
jgi:hypothetical protein